MEGEKDRAFLGLMDAAAAGRLELGWFADWLRDNRRSLADSPREAVRVLRGEAETLLAERLGTATDNLVVRAALARARADAGPVR